MPADYLLSVQKAHQQYDAAFHLLNVTFPFVKDPKLLMGVISNILSSLEHAMDAILAYERQLRLVPNYSNEFLNKFNLFRYKCVRRNKIPQKFINMIIDLKEIETLHRKSPISFQRGNKYILASQNYQLKVISIGDIKNYLNQTKEFLAISTQIINIDNQCR
jgi:hypothetical protein